MNKRVLLIMSVVCMVLISSLTAFAQVALISTSPTVGANRFPDYIVDSAGLQLGLCDVDNGVDANGDAIGPCLLAPGITNYWAADAMVADAVTGERYLLSMSISAIVEPGLVMLSNDLEIKLRQKQNLAAGTYTVETPYGPYLLTVPGDRKDHVEKFGIESIISCTGAACAEGVLLPGPPFAIPGPIFGTLLTAKTGPPAAPAGFVGAGLEIGAETPPGSGIFYQGSPLDVPGPEFKVTAPNGTVLAQTNLFTVQGKLFTGVPGVPPAPGAVVTDTVTLQSTTFNARRGILTINVASSQAALRPTITALVNNSTIPITLNRAGVLRLTRATGLAPGLNSIRITSSLGGTFTTTVTVP